MRFLLLVVLIASLCQSVNARSGSLSTVIKKQFDNALISLGEPLLHVESLYAAPQSALLVHSLSFLAASTVDVSLKNNNTQTFIRNLTTPTSFRASLYQTTRSIANAFNTAQRGTFKIQMKLKNVPSVMVKVVELFANPQRIASLTQLQGQLKTFCRILTICREESTNIAKSFEDTMQLISELVNVTSLTYGDKDNNNKIIKNLLKNLDEDKISKNQENDSLKEEIKQQNEDMQQARNNHQAIINDILNRGIFNRFAISIQSIFGEDPASSDRTAMETTMKLYKMERKTLEGLKEKEDANSKSIARIAKKIASSQQKQVDLQEVMYYLAEGVKILGQVQGNWEKLRRFFTWVEWYIGDAITQEFLDFGNKATEKNAAGNADFIREMIITTFKAVALCGNVGRSAKIYYDLSKDHVMPTIDSAPALTTMTKEKMQEELMKINTTMEREKQASILFLERKMQEAQENAEEELQQVREEFELIFD